MTMTTREVLETAAAYIKEAIDQLPADPPEVPDTIEQRPTNDKPLRGDFWKDKDGDIYRFSDGWWELRSPRDRDWAVAKRGLDNEWAPFTRTTDPSLPRTWDTLDAVDTDVECATGDYAGMCREFARSPLSESGWFQWLKDESYGGWVELPVDRTKHVTNIRENQ